MFPVSLLYTNLQAQAKNSAVIIVGTHLDEIKRQSKLYPARWEEDMYRLVKERYCRPDNDNSGLPNVIDIVNVAAGRSPRNIDVLEKCIYNKVFKLNHPGRDV